MSDSDMGVAPFTRPNRNRLVYFATARTSATAVFVVHRRNYGRV